MVFRWVRLLTPVNGTRYFLNSNGINPCAPSYCDMAFVSYLSAVFIFQLIVLVSYIKPQYICNSILDHNISSDLINIILIYQ